MKIIATLCSAFLWFLGAIFVLAAFHPDAVAQGKSVPRALVGAVLIVGGVALAYFAWRSPKAGAGAGGATVGGQEPPGALSMKALTCPHCGGQVNPDSARVGPEGTLTITCGYCKGTFLVQEDPKW